MIDLFRHIWNSSLKSLVTEIRMKLSGVRGDSAEEERLKGVSRFVSGETSLLGRPVKYVDAPSYLFMRREIFESEIYRFQCSTQNPYIIDCGANIGLSVIYFKKLYPYCTILAFEPDVNIFSVLSENMATFALQGITLSNKALWSKEARVPFIQEGADGGRIDASISGSPCSVTATTLSQYLVKHVDFLKLDIEGAEGDVLEECREGLAHVERMFLEYHSAHGEPQQLGRILEILRGAGFRYYIEQIGITSGHPFIRRHTCNNFDNQLNIYAYRP